VKSRGASQQVCTHAATCELYQHFRLSANLAIWQNRYCNSRYERCERFKLAAQGAPVPALLLPNGVLLRTPK
jgi:hypothetical protein